MHGLHSLTHVPSPANVNDTLTVTSISAVLGEAHQYRILVVHLVLGSKRLT